MCHARPYSCGSPHAAHITTAALHTHWHLCTGISISGVTAVRWICPGRYLFAQRWQNCLGIVNEGLPAWCGGECWVCKKCGQEAGAAVRLGRPMYGAEITLVTFTLGHYRKDHNLRGNVLGIHVATQYLCYHTYTRGGFMQMFH